jgi:small subunit ribosomal protein S13
VLVAKRNADLMKKLNSWKGVCHSPGLKVREQRTATTGRVGAVAGVIKKKAAEGGK